VLALKAQKSGSRLCWLNDVSDSELQKLEISEDRLSINWPTLGKQISIDEVEASRILNVSHRWRRQQIGELRRQDLITRTETVLRPHVWRDLSANYLYDLHEDGTCRQRRIGRGVVLDMKDSFLWKYAASVLTITQVLADPMALSATLAQACGHSNAAVTEFIHEFRPGLFDQRVIEFMGTTSSILGRQQFPHFWQLTKRPKGWS
jgi:hypothetical protein